MNGKYQLIATDLDGTLFSDYKELTAYTKAFLVDAMEQGIYFVPATGRALGAVPKYVLNLPGLRYIMTSNGANIYDLVENKKIYSKVLNIDKVYDIFNRLKHYDVWKEICIDGINYVEKQQMERLYELIPQEFARQYLTRTRQTVDSLEEIIENRRYELEKVCFFFPDVETKWKAIEDFGFMMNVSAVDATTFNFEVSDEYGTKAHALKFLAEYLNIPMEKVIACGDGRNDVDMIKLAGMGVAMKNGVEEARLAADYIAEDNNEEGVYKALVDLLG